MDAAVDRVVFTATPVFIPPSPKRMTHPKPQVADVELGKRLRAEAARGRKEIFLGPAAPQVIVGAGVGLFRLAVAQQQGGPGAAARYQVVIARTIASALIP